MAAMSEPQDEKSVLKPEQNPAEDNPAEDESVAQSDTPREIGGRAGPEPTRFGDWEKNGRCIDF